jgi:uridine kinase
MGRIIISICGGSGSGKSMLAKHLAEKLGPEIAARIPTDFYLKTNHYCSREEFLQHPLQYDWELLTTILGGVDGTWITSPIYDFIHFERIAAEGGRSFILRPIMIMDAMIPYPIANIALFMRCPDEERKRRIIERDQQWRTRVIDYWNVHQVTLKNLLCSSPRFDLELDGLEPVETNVERVLSLLPACDTQI